jgi:hypothetical protein
MALEGTNIAGKAPKPATRSFFMPSFKMPTLRFAGGASKAAQR